MGCQSADSAASSGIMVFKSNKEVDDLLFFSLNLRRFILVSSKVQDLANTAPSQHASQTDAVLGGHD